jgi:hypothetical protein
MNITKLRKLWYIAGVIVLAGCATNSETTRYDWNAPPAGDCYTVAHISPDLTRGLWFLIAPAGSQVTIAINGNFNTDFRFQDNIPKPLAPMALLRDKPLVLSCRLYPVRGAA